MLRHAHLYMKGGKRALAAGAKGRWFTQQSRHSTQTIDAALANVGTAKQSLSSILLSKVYCSSINAVHRI
jgi:hypothetical protein